jgi:predicted O-methyltransferase YrrM
MKTIESQVNAVEGWLNPSEAKLLFKRANECAGKGVIVEIGSWKGKSTICLARGSIEGGRVKVHAIDPHTGSTEHHEAFGKGNVWTFDEFQQNIQKAGVDHMITPHVDFSENVAKKFDQPVEFIFIDGLHEYEGVKVDFDSWFSKVVDGGYIAFHDSTCWDGVKKVVVEDVFRSNRFRKIRVAGSIVCAQKVAQNTALERLGNRLMLPIYLLHCFTDRMLWRLLHHYLDFPITRHMITRVKAARLMWSKP